LPTENTIGAPIKQVKDNCQLSFKINISVPTFWNKRFFKFDVFNF